MKLKIILSDIVNIDKRLDCDVSGITIDSRTVQAGDLFIAYRGDVLDGRNYINDAIKKGAAAIFCEDEIPDKIINPNDIPIIIIPKLKEFVGQIAARFYGNPSKKLTIIGVTGTNGKTSTTQFIASALTSLGIPCGVIGTIGVGFPGKLSPLLNTTPDIVTIQRWFHEFQKNGAKAVAMEVSSHSLVQPQRTQGINFKIAVFTNLTRDHLDYHKTMENYGAAKKLLFTRPNLAYAVINADDDFGRNLLQVLPKTLKQYAYTCKEVTTFVPTISANNIELDLHGFKAKVSTPWGGGTLSSHLLGRFNISNLLATLAVLGIMRVKLRSAISALNKLSTVDGRMQTLGGGKKPLVVIDYSHTPDALEQALLALREHCRGAIWCVFGCGGDRDRGKRQMMGAIAERLSDHVIITNDNPRTEDPEQISKEVLSGLLCPWAAEVELDRRAAIAHAISCAEPTDVVLIAGKGHEDYQILGTEKIHFSDFEIAKEILAS